MVCVVSSTRTSTSSTSPIRPRTTSTIGACTARSSTPRNYPRTSAKSGRTMLGHGPSTPKGPRCCLVRRRIITSHWCMRAPIRFTEPIRKPKRSPRRASTGRRRLRATSRWRMRRNTTSCDARNPPIPGTSWTRCSSCSILTPNTASMPSVTDWTARKHQDQGRTSV